MTTSYRRLLRTVQCRSAPPREGALLVELALVLPIMFLMLVAFLELSRAWMLKQSADSAAYEGARAGIVAGATPAEARAASEALLRASGVKSWTIDISPNAFTETTSVVNVTVHIPIRGNVWISPMFFRESEVVSNVMLITERPAAIQLTGIDEATSGVLGISALGLGL